MMMVVGMKFNNLILYSKSYRVRRGGEKVAQWSCRCECGCFHTADESDIKQGIVKYCSKCSEKRKSSRFRKYGVAGEEVYYAWQMMKSMCDDENDSSYKNYGGRGITYCKRWKDFNNFISDMGMKPSGSHRLKRIDVDAEFSPANCIWERRSWTKKTDRVYKYIVEGKQYKTITEIAKDYGLSRSVCDGRLKSYKYPDWEKI